MAGDQSRERSATSATGSAAYPLNFEEFIQQEVDHINRRRERVAADDGTTSVKVELGGAGPGAELLDVVGLTMSGGGIRSASFCLGVSQALDVEGVFKHIDYLSTVSGGGYLGASISTTMTATNGRFVFGETTQSGGNVRKSDIKDTPAVAHIRDYSNYLIPRGPFDLITALAIVLRGLIANAALVLPVVLILAAATVAANPTRSLLLKPDILGFEMSVLPVRHFGLTLLLLMMTFLVFLFWALYRSMARRQSEFGTRIPFYAAWYLVGLSFVAFLELQPYVISGMFDLYETVDRSDASNHSLLARVVQWATTLAAPFIAAITFFRQQIATLLKSVTSSSSASKKTAAFAGQAALWIGGAAVPLLIWIGYLFLCYWAIYDDGKAKSAAPSAAAIQGTFSIVSPNVSLKGELDCRASVEAKTCGTTGPSTGGVTSVDPHKHTPTWLRTLACGLSETQCAQAVNKQIAARAASPAPSAVTASNKPENPPPAPGGWPYVIVYVASAVFLAISWIGLTPNANSLHRLYRDRLSKAFLFDPRETKATTGTQDARETRDLLPLDRQLISALSGENGPYHLINAALNIQGSKFANRRGRNADFFLFSPLKVGSVATGYVDTWKMEPKAQGKRRGGLDLATAMAISGAAFSSNMGANSVKALTITLALLNVRTGYWLDNPKYVESKQEQDDKLFDKSNVYLLSELTSGLDENSEKIYVTDGGHIENLGIYELLRRRCRTIVVIDAEADPAMRFSSFVTLQRYARIDLGARIYLPWDLIRTTTLRRMGAELSAAEVAQMKQVAKDVGDDAISADHLVRGPHAAIGRIVYDDGKEGQILYIKSSLSGDENDYVCDYARRFSEFPHETTGDQFFSEEQFEAYRALGFHIAARILSGDDLLQVEGSSELHNMNSSYSAVEKMRDALFGRALRAG